MNIVLVILAAAVGIFFLSTVATCIYRAGYEKQISKRLAKGDSAERSRKPILSPYKFFWSCTLLFSLLTLMLLSVASFSVTSQKNLACVSQCNSDGITGMFNAQNEISGYVRNTKEDERFQFVYYLQNKNMELAFPQILIYVESRKDEPFSYQYQFRDAKNVSSSEVQQGNSGWYAVNYDTFSGTFIFSCDNSSGSSSIEITIIP